MIWIKRFSVAAVPAIAFLIVVDLLKGRGIETSVTNGVIWGLLVASILTATQYVRRRRTAATCVLCVDEAPDEEPEASVQM